MRIFHSVNNSTYQMNSKGTRFPTVRVKFGGYLITVWVLNQFRVWPPAASYIYAWRDMRRIDTQIAVQIELSTKPLFEGVRNRLLNDPHVADANLPL